MKYLALLAGCLFFTATLSQESVLNLESSGATTFMDSLNAGEPASIAEQTLILSRDEFTALLDLKPGEEVALPGLNLNLNKGEAMSFRRYNPYAAGARIRVGNDAEPKTLVPSGRVFLLGKSRTGAVSLALDPRTSRVFGMVIDGAESYRISGQGRADGSVLVELINLRDEISSTPFQCGTQPEHTNQTIAEKGVFPSLNASRKGGPVLFQTTIAVETNVAFTGQARFGGDNNNVVTYIEDLFTGMNAIYERDLQLHLNIGDVIINDVTDPAPNYDSLNAFSNFWAANRDGISRDFALLLADINGGFSGLATVNAYCDNNNSYSYNGIGGGFSAAGAAEFVGHEIGHNLGSSHTHCELLANGGADFVDQCYSCEDNDGTNCFTSCYVGPTMCQPGNSGTVMSYCHADADGFDGGGPATGTVDDCTSSGQFHPLIINKLSDLLADNNPQCIENFLPVGDFDLTLGDDQLEICKPAIGSTSVTVTANAGSGFTDPVNLTVSQLPGATTGMFDPSTLTPGNSATFTIDNTNGAADGSYRLAIVGSTATAQTSKTLDLILVTTAANGPALTAPADGAMNLSTATILDWDAVVGAISYRIDIATDAGLNNVVETATVTSTQYQPMMLDVQTTYYWRVVANPACGNQAASTTRSFTTALEFCQSPNAVINAQVFNQTFDMTPGLVANVTDMDVFVQIDGTFAEAFDVQLTRGGTSRTLMSAPAFDSCNSGQNLAARFDDEAATALIDACNAGQLGANQSLMPSESLGPFDGEALAATWQLQLDNFSTNTPGTLVRWCLIPTTDAPVLNTLNVSVAGPGTVTSSPGGIDCPGTCNADFADGNVSLTATPSGPAIFAGWSGDCSGTGNCTVSMSADRNVGATFTDDDLILQSGFEAGEMPPVR